VIFFLGVNDNGLTDNSPFPWGKGGTSCYALRGGMGGGQLAHPRKAKRTRPCRGGAWPSRNGDRKVAVSWAIGSYP